METAAAISLAFLVLDRGIPYVEKLIETAKQNKELTPEQEAEFDAKMLVFKDKENKPEYWKTDEERGLTN